ncbi:hypothetical protein H7I76_26460, partial [Mycolicibacterium vaccae]|nr:hypothetical protein [Mycolicibacterium vaccae]
MLQAKTNRPAREVSCALLARSLDIVTTSATNKIATNKIARNKIAETLRGLGSTVIATARQVPRRRIAVTAAAVMVWSAVALLVPLPMRCSARLAAWRVAR